MKWMHSWFLFVPSLVLTFVHARRTVWGNVRRKTHQRDLEMILRSATKIIIPEKGCIPWFLTFLFSFQIWLWHFRLIWLEPQCFPVSRTDRTVWIWESCVVAPRIHRTGLNSWQDNKLDLHWYPCRGTCETQFLSKYPWWCFCSVQSTKFGAKTKPVQKISGRHLLPEKAVRSRWQMLQVGVIAEEKPASTGLLCSKMSSTLRFWQKVHVILTWARMEWNVFSYLSCQATSTIRQRDACGINLTSSVNLHWHPVSIINC